MIALPAGFALGDRDVARAAAQELGDDPSQIIGLIEPVVSPDDPAGASPDPSPAGLPRWSMWIAFHDLGYVSDADAASLDADELAAQMRASDERQNQVRRSKGRPTLTLEAWSTLPSYRSGDHVLRWGTRLRSSDGERFGNENIRRLGRRGMVSLVVVASADEREAAMAAAAPVIDAVTFLEGHRYEDFDPATDPHSGLTLTNLIVGGGAVATASKLGLFGKLLVAGKKLVLVIALAIGGLWRWLFGGRGRRRSSESG